MATAPGHSRACHPRPRFLAKETGFLTPALAAPILSSHRHEFIFSKCSFSPCQLHAFRRRGANCRPPAPPSPWSLAVPTNLPYPGRLSSLHLRKCTLQIPTASPGLRCSCLSVSQMSSCPGASSRPAPGSFPLATPGTSLGLERPPADTDRGPGSRSGGFLSAAGPRVECREHGAGTEQLPSESGGSPPQRQEAGRGHALYGSLPRLKARE